MQKPLISITLAYIAGILLGHGFLYFPLSFCILLFLGILTASIFVWFDKLALRHFLFILLTGLAGIAAYLYSSAWLPADHYTKRFTPDRKTHEIIGTITAPLDRDPDRTAFVLEVKSIDASPVSGTMRVSVRDDKSTVGYGDIITIRGKVLEPRSFRNPGGFDYVSYLARNGIYYTISVKDFSHIEILKRGKGVFRAIQDRRERIRQSFLAATAGPGSAILQAMVIGEEGRLTDDLRDQFMAAGVTHIISISGSHLGMVAILCFGLLRALLFLLPQKTYHWLTLHIDPKKMAALLTIPLVVFYTLLAGGQVATVRSLIMIMAGLFALFLDRDNSLVHALAVAALLILVPSPQALFDISFQLSFISVLVIGFVVSLWNLRTGNAFLLKKWRDGVGLLAIISLSTALATGPIVAYYFNQFSFAGIISNMIVVPFAGAVLVPLGLFSALLSLFFNYLPFATLNQALSDAFVATVAFFSRLPFAEYHPAAPTPWRLLLYALFMISVAMLAGRIVLARLKPFETSSRLPKSTSVAAAVSGCLLLLSSLYASFGSQQSEITFLDVGQGDCAVVRLASGKTILIDGGGTHDNRFDIGRRVVAPYLWNKGLRSIDLVILSHPHPDHMNGLHYIVKKFEIGQVWDSGRDSHLPGYAEFRQVLAEKKVRHTIVHAEDSLITLGEAELRILHPTRSFVGHHRQAYAAENDRSLVVSIAFQKKRCVFTGDIGTEAEQRLLRDGIDLACDLLKIPHHGSKSSSSEEFVYHTRPEIAIASAGQGNLFGHPSPDVAARYETRGTRFLRIDRDGAIIVKPLHDGWEIMKWTDLVLKRNGLDNPSAWKKQEADNWRRTGRKITLKTP